MVWRVLLLSAWLCFSLASTQGHVRQERPWERREEAPDTALLGNEHYEKLQSHLGTVRALSRRYWHFLACRMWQEGCEEEKKEQEVVAATQQEEEKEKEEEGNKVILEHQGWSLPIVTEMVSNWYCSFGKCCATGDCRVTNNITGLDLDLSRRLHGQHLVKHVVVKAIQGFLETPEPEKALTLSFHGWSGTGKNFVARMIAEHLYQDGLKSDCVKVFISLFHFPHSKYVDIYKVQLAKEISKTVQLCEQSLFIFDEAEKLHAGLLDAIKPYVDHYDSINAVNYRRSIFLFLSNTGANIINEVALDFWRTGRAREEITMEFLEPYLRAELMEATVNPFPNGSWWKKTEVTARKPRMSYTELFSAPMGSFRRTHNVSHAEEQGLTDKDYTYNGLLEDNLIDFLVPFLPLEYRHVKLCARDASLARGLPFTEEALDEIARMMVFVPKEEKLFSAQGCKSVSQRINYFIP